MARPIAPRFHTLVLKNKSGTDPAQVPASDGRLDFYKPGATVKTAVTLEAFEDGVAVDVYDAGRILPGDTVRVDVGPTQLYVSDVLGLTQLSLTNNTGSTVTLAVGVRLVPMTNRPAVYADPLGSVPLVGSYTGVDGNGHAQTYLSEDRVDYDVTIPGQAVRLYTDASGEHGRSDQRWSDLRDYGGDLQAAIDRLPADGGIVFVPHGTWLVSSGVTINKPNVTIVGEQAGSVLKAATPNGYDLITVNQTYFQMRDLTLDGAATSYDPAGKSCLSVQGVANLSLWGVTILGAPRYGLWLRDVKEFFARSCAVVFNWGTGVRIETVSAGATANRIVAAIFGQNGGRGIEAIGVTGLMLVKCVLEGNGIAAGEDDGAGVDAESCERVELRSCYFEDADNGTTTPTSQFVALRGCESSIVDSCWFQGGSDSSKQPLRAVKFVGSPWSRFTNCVAQGMASALALFDAQSPDCLEFGTRDFNPLPGDFPHIQVDAQRFIGMSRHALSVPEHTIEDTRPPADAAPPGAIVWADSPGEGRSNLQVWDGAAWRSASIL